MFNIQVGFQRLQAHLVEQLRSNVDWRTRAQGQSDGIAGTCVDVFYRVILLYNDSRVVNGAAHVVDDNLAHAYRKGIDHRSEQVVRDWACRSIVFQPHPNGGRFKFADGNGQEPREVTVLLAQPYQGPVLAQVGANLDYSHLD